MATIRSTETTPTGRIYEAEREAAEQIEASRKRVKEAQIEDENRIEQVRQDYHKQTEAEALRHEASIEAQKNKGYAGLRELKRAQDKEALAIRRQGDAETQRLNTHYNETLYATERRGQEKLEELERKNSSLEAFAQKQGTDRSEAENKNQELSVQQLKDNHENKYNELLKTYNDQYQKTLENSQLATEQSRNHFDERFANNLKQQQQTLLDMENKANKQLLGIRADTSRKLAAYSDRQNDPFYQMMDTQAKLEDQGEFYQLTAKIPEHERKNITVSVQGSRIVLSGTRRNEERLDLAPGRTMGTAAFQNFTETFPLLHPVEAKALTREFDGDSLIIRIPKKATYSEHQPFKAATPTALALERPKFPENLALGPSKKENPPLG